MLKRIDENVLLASPRFTKQKEYWMAKLAKDMPVTEIQPDTGRVNPGFQQEEPGQIGICFPGYVCTRLIQFSKTSDLSLYIVLLTGIKLLIYYYTGNEDIGVLSPLYSPNINDVTINDCLMIRDRISGPLTFIDFLLDVRKSVLEAYENQDFPFDKVMEHVLAGDAAQVGGELSTISCSLTNIHSKRNIHTLDCKLKFIFWREQNQVKGSLQYDPNLYSFDYSKQLGNHYIKILENTLENINTKISDISFLSEDEKRRLIFSFNNTSTEYPRDKKIHRLFEEQVEKTPDHIALIGREQVVWGEEGGVKIYSIKPSTDIVTISYRELNERSNLVTSLLRKNGIASGRIAAIIMERSQEMIIGIMGILKSGAAYLPIDPFYPVDRVNYILADSGVKQLLTTRDLFIDVQRDRIPRWEGKVIFLDGVLESSELAAYYLPSDAASDLAYIIYTSGSTGRPKGVLIEQCSVVNLLMALFKEYPFSPMDTYLLKTAYVFDVSVTELFGWFLGGGRLAILEKNGEKDPSKILDAVESTGVTHINFVPSMFNVFVEALDGQNIHRLKTLKYIFLAGEALLPQLVEKFRQFLTGIRLENIYGPTEGTVYASSYSVDLWKADGGYEIIPIGKPVQNVKLWILSKVNRLQPVGVPGQLHFSGIGVARGYLNNPELTAEKFVDFSGIIPHPSRLYKTGDHARWLPDGNIEFLGRIDSQVKIRGFRIELGEIENQLLKHEAVKEVVVIERQEGDSNKYLCAYIVIKKMAEQALALNNKQLKNYLSRTLPDYMIPAHFVFLDKIPFNVNGKIDKKALPKPQMDKETVGMYIAPRNEVENKLAGIWAEVLGIEKNIIGIDLDFFDVGGNSFKGTIAISRISKDLNIKIPLTEFFIHKTIRNLSAYVQGTEADEYAAIMPAEKKDYYLLPSTQMRMYFLQQFDLDNIAYNMPQVLILGENIDKAKLETTFKRLIQRHESLRTSFLTIEGKLVQKIHENVDFEISFFEMNCKGGAQAEDEIISSFVRAFDLSSAPLLRAGLIETSEKKHILMVDMHHIISDGMSQKILIQDFMKFFTGKELSPLKLQYKDYSEWQNSNLEKGELISQKEYWLNEFKEDIPVINLPTDYPRPTRQSFEGRSIGFEVCEEDQKVLNEMAQIEGATIFMVLLGIYNIFLSKISSQEDITVGAPIAGRRHNDLQTIIGMFVNTLALRNYPAGEKPFPEFLNEVKQRSLNAFENQDYPFENLVENIAIERDMSHNPLFDVMFIMENIFDASPNMPPREMQDLTAKPYQFDNQTAKFDLSLYTIEKDQKLFFTFEYCTRLFKEETIKRLIRYLKKIITSITENPGKKISEIEMISNEEKNQVLYNFNVTSVDLPEYQTLPQIFEKQVERVPDKMAIVGQSIWGLQESSILNVQITYRELDNKSNHLAYLLKEKGIKADTIVGLMLERCVEMIVGIIGILKAGGAYLPIDPRYPEERVNYMLKDSNAKILINKSEIRNPKSETNSNDQNANVQNENRIPFVLDFENLKFSFFSCSEFRTPDLIPSNLAYIIYTSGSTGKPKGVMIENRSVVNRLNWMQRLYPLDENDVILQKTNVTFDVSVWELFWWFFDGASVCLLEPGGEKAPGSIIKAIEKSKVTTIHFVPSMFNVFLDYLEAPGNVINPVYLRRIFSSGEALKVEHVAKFNKLLHKTYKIGLINLYGPTEATVDVSYYDCLGDNENEIIPIGKPIDNIVLYILDEYLHIQPVGISGELFIGGIGLARGYLNRPELTSEKFIADPFREGERMYKTGDLARWLPDGNIEFLGRIDLQVKIRGFRIELEEIETQLMSYEKIKDAVVVVKEDDRGDPSLCAFIVGASGAAVEAIHGSIELREYLSGKLPAYMIPSYFVTLDKISLNANGKIDRKSLVVPEIKQEDNYIPPRNDVEKRLQHAWSIVLGIKRDIISMNSNFFELGGHSLKATILATKIYEEFNVTIPLALIFKTPRISGLAKIIIDATKETYLEILPVEKKEFYPQSSAQKRLFFLDQFENIGTSYNMPAFFNLNVELDRKRIENTFRKLLQRHESLRTSFEIIDNEPIQRVHDYLYFEVEEFVLNEGASKEENLQQIMNCFNRPFDISKAPLLRFGLASFGEREHLLLFDMHHIISDGASINILIRDFSLLYAGKEIPSIHIQYKDFSAWQNYIWTDVYLKEQQEYWLSAFAGDIPVLNLPTDYPRPRLQSYEGRHLNSQVDAQSTNALRVFISEQEGTLFMVLLAVFNVLLHKLSGQEDIIVGVPVAGRKSSSLQLIIGMFANTLALRVFPSERKTFQQFFNEVKQKSIEAFDNQDIQFEDLVDTLNVKRDTSRNPLFDVKFVVQNAGKADDEISNLGIMPYKYDNPTSKFDLSLDVIETGEHLFLIFEYCTKIFRQPTIERIINYFRTILSFILENPGVKIYEIDILSKEEKNRILYNFNNTKTEFPEQKKIHDFLEEQAQKTPDKIAVVFENEFVTYSELDTNSNQLANFLLMKKCIHPGNLVGLLMQRSSHLITAIQGILKAGGAYVPINVALPEEGIGQIINDAGLELVISQKKFIKILNRLQWECTSFRTFLCMDSIDIYSDEEMEKNELMNKKLWEYVGDTAIDEITGGGWISSYTGNPFSKEEMDEYGDNILDKLTPFLHTDMRVLEIGCASGLTMFRIAPKVAFYYGTDLSTVIINKNKERVKKENHQNIALLCTEAHEIDTIEERNFNLVIINSVIHCFDGHNYLRKVIGKALSLLGGKGYLFIGDIMDVSKKKQLIGDMKKFKRANRNKNYKTKTDWSAELFVSREFFKDLSNDFPIIQGIEFSDKIHTIENELTRFRYDALFTVDKATAAIVQKTKYKYQHDLSTLSFYDKGKVSSRGKPDQVAYVIYTSGSTGMPKGVVIEHRSVVNRLNWMQKFYPINEEDIILQKTPIFFDVSVWELFWWSFVGASLYLLKPGGEKDPWALIDAVEKNRVTVMHFVPSMLNAFLEYIKESSQAKKLGYLRQVFSSGEALKSDQVNRFYRYFPRKKTPGIKFVNLYGPTEATVDVSYFNCSADTESNVIPIGKPIDNINLLICENSLKLKPIGLAGELFIGGVGVARGYLNRVELTNAKFIANPFIAGDTLYKTGDLCRWLADGNIEFLGRMDQQVKIRGLRIELEEIQNHLLNLEEIKQVVVTVKEDMDGDRYLCAYIVPIEQDRAVDFSHVKEYLLGKLPDYMVPAFFKKLDQIPLLSNGKININALPDHKITLMDDYAAPVSKIEKKLTEMWSEILGIDKNMISALANFFELGGHSLKATILVSRIHKELNIRVPLAEIFNTPTIRGLAESLGQLTEVKFAAIDPVEEREYYPLSSAQRRLYALHQMDETSTRFNMPMVFGWKGFIDKDEVEDTFKKLIQRHESFRTSFEVVMGRLVQRLHKDVPFELEYFNLVEGKPRVAGIPEGEIVNNFLRGFVLSRAPLLRVGLIKSAEKSYTLMVDMHHIISDGTSMDILQREFRALFGGEKLSPLKLNYRDFSQWQNRLFESGYIKKQEEYWLNRFKGEIPVLNLPLDYRRPEFYTARGSRIPYEIDEETTLKIRQLVLETGTTLFMVLLAGYTVMLSKYSGQDDIIVGTPIAGRRYADLENIIGLFVNMLAIRNRAQEEKTFKEFLDEVKTNALDAYENQDYQFENLVWNLKIKVEPGRNPLFDAVFVLQNAGTNEKQISKIDKPGEKNNTSIYGKELDKVHHELLLNVLEGKDTLFMVLEYSTELFNESTARKMSKRYVEVLKQIIENKEIKLRDIKISHDLIVAKEQIALEEEEDFRF